MLFARRTELADVVEILTGIGRLLQRIDAKLEEIVDSIGDEEDGTEDQS